MTELRPWSGLLLNRLPGARVSLGGGWRETARTEGEQCVDTARAGQPVRRPVLEPTYVTRRRRTEALAELVREFRDQNENQRQRQSQVEGQSQGQSENQGYEQDLTVGESFESIVVSRARRRPRTRRRNCRLPQVPQASHVSRKPSATKAGACGTEGADGASGTKGAPRAARGRRTHPAPCGDHGGSDRGGPHRRRRSPPPAGRRRRRRIAGRGPPSLSPPVSSAAASTPARQGTDPDGAGTLREGDSGPEVSALQQRLLHIPNVYDSGSTSGQYDATLTAAVARFQLWYGIRATRPASTATTPAATSNPAPRSEPHRTTHRPRRCAARPRRAAHLPSSDPPVTGHRSAITASAAVPPDHPPCTPAPPGTGRSRP